MDRDHTPATFDILATVSETMDSQVTNFNSTDGVQHILSRKEDIVKELALLYVRKKLSLSAHGCIAKLIVALGHNIPIDPRAILQTTNTPIRNKSFHLFSFKRGLLFKTKKGIIDRNNYQY